MVCTLVDQISVKLAYVKYNVRTRAISTAGRRGVDEAQFSWCEVTRLKGRDNVIFEYNDYFIRVLISFPRFLQQ